MSVFENLNSVNVTGHTEKRNGLTYLSWAWAWTELCKMYPDAQYRVYENADGWNYHTDGRTAWVKTSVTVEGKECVEMLPVMDFRNRSIPLESITSMDVNKAIQRSITKCIARHGLGICIYNGSFDDIPEESATDKLAREIVNRSKDNEQTDPETLKQDIIRLTGGDMSFIADSIARAKTGAKSLDDLTVEQLVKFKAFLEKRR